MPKKLRPKSRRQRQAVAPLTQVRRTARFHHSKQAKRKAKSSQGRRPCHQNTVHQIPSHLQEADSSSSSCRTYKNSEELRSRIRSGIITPIHEQWEKARVSSPQREFPPATAGEVDPLRISSHHPHTLRQPPW